MKKKSNFERAFPALEVGNFRNGRSEVTFMDPNAVRLFSRLLLFLRRASYPGVESHGYADSQGPAVETLDAS